MFYLQDERDSWVRALTQLISPAGIATTQHPQQQPVTSSHIQQRGNQSVSPNHSDRKGTDSPEMQTNKAYGYLTPQPTTAVATAFTSYKPKIPELPPAVADYVITDDHESRTEEAGHRDEPKPRPLSDPGYDFTKNTTVPEPAPENRLSHFTSNQMEHLRRTDATQPQNLGSGPIQPQEKAAAVRASVTTPPPRLPKPTLSDPAISKASSGSAASLANSRQQQSQLSLSTDSVSAYDDIISHSSRERSGYVNTIPLASEKENGKGIKGEGERVGISVPTLVIESTDHEESAPPVQHRKSAGLLSTAETANAKLGESML